MGRSSTSKSRPQQEQRSSRSRNQPKPTPFDPSTTSQESDCDRPKTEYDTGRSRWREDDGNDDEEALMGNRNSGAAKGRRMTWFDYLEIVVVLALVALGGLWIYIEVQKNASSSSSASLLNINPLDQTPSRTYTMPGITKNNIGIGFLSESFTVTDINAGLGIKSSFYGWYTQTNYSGGTWDGTQLLAVKADVIASGAIFVPAIMPCGPTGWSGLTATDNSMALTIASVLKQFTDAGVTVWLRFAHEVNLYQSTGLYPGTAADFKTAWGVVAAAVASNPMVSMFFTPNYANDNLATYTNYYPTDPTTVDIIGIDYYYAAGGPDFITVMKPFHDKYCTVLNATERTSDHATIFAIGESGLGFNADINTKLNWLDSMTNSATKAALPYLAGVNWFNYAKGTWDSFIYEDGNTTDNTATKAWLATGTVASGVIVP